MATAEVKSPKPAMVSPYAVKGYRPESMDVPTGPVLKTGPRRPAAGYQSNTPVKAGGALTKPMGTGTVDRIPSTSKRTTHTVKPQQTLGRPGRVIIPNNGISLPNSNR